MIPETFTIEWTDESSSSAAGRTASAASPGVSYVVQISKDGGETWQTFGYGQDLTRLEADPSFLEDANQIEVRVTSTDGFSCQTTTQTIEL